MTSGGRRDRAQSRINEVDEAARAVIVRKGLASTTMRDISREAGFTTGLLTHYFSDKESLIAGVFAAASERWIAQVRTAMTAAETAVDRWRAVVLLAVPDPGVDRENWRLWLEMWTYATGNPGFAEYIVKTDLLWEIELRGLLERSIGEGLLQRTLDVPVQALAIARLVDGLGIRSVLGGQWEQARLVLIGYLEAIGMVPEAVAELRGVARR